MLSDGNVALVMVAVLAAGFGAGVLLRYRRWRWVLIAAVLGAAGAAAAGALVLHSGVTESSTAVGGVAVAAGMVWAAATLAGRFVARRWRRFRRPKLAAALPEPVLDMAHWWTSVLRPGSGSDPAQETDPPMVGGYRPRPGREVTGRGPASPGDGRRRGR